MGSAAAQRRAAAVRVLRPGHGTAVAPAVVPAAAPAVAAVPPPRGSPV